MRTRNIKSTLIATIAILLSLMIIFFVWLTYQLTYKAVEGAYFNQAHNLSKTTHDSFTMTYESMIQRAKSLANDPITINAAETGDYNAAQKYYESYFQSEKIFEGLFLSTAEQNSMIVANGNKGGVGVVWRNTGFNENLDNTLAGETHISRPQKSPVTGEVVVLITVPVKINGKVKGIFGLPFYVRRLATSIENTVLGKDGYIFISDNAGLVFSHPDQEQVLKLDITKLSFGKEAMKAPSKSIIHYEWKGEDKVLSVYHNKKYGFHIFASMYSREFSKTAYSILFGIIAGGVAGVIIITVIMIWILNRRLNPLKDLVTVAEQLSHGDIQVNLQKKYDDEVGYLVDAIKEMADNLSGRVGLIETFSKKDFTAKLTLNSDKDALGKALKEMVENMVFALRKISDYTVTLSDASSELSLISNQLATGSEEMRSQADGVAAASEEMSNTMNSMSSTSNEITINVTSISSTSEQMSANMMSVNDSISELTESMKAINSSALQGGEIASNGINLSKESDTAMAELGNKAEEIGEVTEVIQEIASRTNLLALNANIEAASAGEAGKGFAVVANEIKELANQSIEAAQRIAEMIKNIQEKTTGAISINRKVSENINSISNNVNEISAAVTRQENATMEIASNIQEATTGVQSVTRSISEAASGSNEMTKSISETANTATEVSSNIQAVNSVVAETSANSVKVNESSNDLSTIAEDLKKMLNSFKLK